MMERYRRKRKVGEGTFGVVYEAVDCSDQSRVAVKRCKQSSVTEGICSSFMREVIALNELQDCPQVIRMRDVVFQKSSVFLVMDWMDRNLHQTIDRRPLGRRLVRVYTRQLLLGLAYSHERQVVHRDLKPLNILIQGEELRIGDWGGARPGFVTTESHTTECVTLNYRAPELLLGAIKYSSAVDMWSVGCIMGEMMTGRLMFPGESQIEMLFIIFHMLGTPDETCWPGVSTLPDWSRSFPRWPPKGLKLVNRKLRYEPDALDLLQKMVILDPAKRITASEALQHPYFTKEHEYDSTTSTTNK